MSWTFTLTVTKQGKETRFSPSVTSEESMIWEQISNMARRAQ